jgi:hypothetical protein
MQIYLPIAEISINILALLALGGAVGFISGMLGIGGGFLMTPLLIFMGVPAPVAVSTGTNQAVATSISGALAQWRRGNVDLEMGVLLLVGGLIGSTAGVYAVKLLRQSGQADLFITLTYVVLLGIVGTLMLVESVHALRRSAKGELSARRRPGQHNWMHGLPLKRRFHRSKLYISAIPPFLIGLFVGILTAVMGVGGGFIMVPAMIYLLRMPTNVVVGTSLFQIIFVTAFTTVLNAAENYSVDMLLTLVLTVGGVLGAQLGVIAGSKLRSEQLRALLALLVLGMALRLLVGLMWAPEEVYSLHPQHGPH